MRKVAPDDTEEHIRKWARQERIKPLNANYAAAQAEIAGDPGTYAEFSAIARLKNPQVLMQL